MKEAASAAPAFDVGHTVHVTPRGIEPLSLASSCCSPVTFVNQTSAPISIVFALQRVNSGPIPPGGSWRWTPANPESVNYHLGDDPSVGGHIQVEAGDW